MFEIAPLTIADGQAMPVINESLLCAHCGCTFRVLACGGGELTLIESRDRERDAHAEIPWCSSCRPGMRTGLTFKRPVPTRGDLRAALKEALDGWEKDAETVNWDRGAPVPADRIVELRKLVEP